jgi:hypothetical protein
VPFWSSSSALSSSSSFTFISNVLYVESQYTTKGSTFASYSVVNDTDTGLGNFDFGGRVSLVSDGKAAITADGDKNKFDLYTSVSVKAGATAIGPIQSQQALTEDTLATLTVDPNGNIVRGSQEATWSFTNAQLNALTNTKVTLLSAPGSGKAIVLEDSNWFMVSDSSTTSGSFGSDLTCEIDGISTSAVATQMVKARMEEISVPAFSGLGIYSRDVPELNRVYRFNAPMTIRAKSGANQFPTRCTSISLKIKYRVFDSSTF